MGLTFVISSCETQATSSSLSSTIGFPSLLHNPEKRSLAVFPLRALTPFMQVGTLTYSKKATSWVAWNRAIIANTELNVAAWMTESALFEEIELGMGRT